MSSAFKVFVKDLRELWHRPAMLILLFCLPAGFLFVAGNVQNEDSQIRLLLKANDDMRPDYVMVKQLLSEFSNIRIIDYSGKNLDELHAMKSNHAHIAMVWNENWEFYLRSTSHKQQQYLTQLIYEIKASLQKKKPWQLSATKSLKKSDKDILSSKVYLFHPLVKNQELELLPKYLSFILVFMPFLFSCSTFIREKERGTLELLLISQNVSWRSIIVGKTLMPMFITLTNLFFLLLFSQSWFELQIKTYLTEAVFVQCLAILASTFLGITVSMLVKTQLQAYLIAALYFLCLILITGFIYPLDQALDVIQITSNIFPLTFSQEYFSDWMLQGSRMEFYKNDVFSLLVQCTVFGITSWLGVVYAKNKL